MTSSRREIALIKLEKQTVVKIVIFVVGCVALFTIYAMAYAKDTQSKIEVSDPGVVQTDYTVQVVGDIVSDSPFKRSDSGLFSVMKSVVSVDDTVAYMGEVWLYAFKTWPDLLQTDIVSSQHTNVELKPDAGNDDCPLRHLNIGFNCCADNRLISQSLTASFIIDHNSESAEALMAVLDEYIGVPFSEEDVNQAVGNLIMLDTTSFEMCDVKVTINLAVVDKLNVYVQWSEF